MLKIPSLKHWTLLPDGKSVNFEHSVESRRVRLDVNAAGTAQVYHTDGNGQLTFLGLVTGREVIEFATLADTSFAISTIGADLWFYSVDGADFSFERPEARSFTQLVERRQRNPEIEYMQYMMQANMNRMMEQQRGELERLFDRRAAALAAPADKPAAAGDGGAGDGAAKPQSNKSASGDVGDQPADAGSGASGGAAKK